MTQEELKLYMKQMTELIEKMEIHITKVIPKDMLSENEIKELK